MFRPDDSVMEPRHSAPTATPMVVPVREQWPPASPLKRGFDLGLSLCLLLLLAPLFLVLAIGVLASSPGPIVYSQQRIGRGGRAFRFYKFRSMVRNSDAILQRFLDQDPAARLEWETYQKLEDDPRITRFGRFIRRTSLDELPQLWNVAIGDMSLVGPRPCMPEQRGLYGSAWGAYCAMRPGISGLWQVSGRNKLSYAQRVQLDVDYVRRWSFLGDLRILAKTVAVVIAADGSR